MKYAVHVPKEQIEMLKQYAKSQGDAFLYPRPAKGPYEIADNQEEKLFWAYKCWVQVLEQAEKGSGLEGFFRRQKLTFDLPDGFVERERLSVSAGGDLMAVDCIVPEFTGHLFDGIREFYMDAELTMANLESTVYEGGPVGRNSIPGMPAKMNTSPAMLEKFVEGGNGIGYFSMANNHCYDYGKDGLLETLDHVEKTGVQHSGTNRKPEAQEKALVFEKNGIRMGMLSYTCDLNGNPCDEKYLMNEVRFNDEVPDLSMIQRHVASAKEQNADIVMVHAHWGWEFEMYPHVNIVNAAHKIAEMGVDVIVGTHPHVAQPMERYEYEKDGEMHACLIIYSLGDFVSFHPITKDSKLTYTVRFDLVKGMEGGREKTFVTGLKMLPVYIMAAETGEEGYDFRLLKFADVLEDGESGGTYRYPLSTEDRADLPRLKEILYQILLPEDAGEVLWMDREGRGNNV